MEKACGKTREISAVTTRRSAIFRAFPRGEALRRRRSDTAFRACVIACEGPVTRAFRGEGESPDTDRAAPATAVRPTGLSDGSCMSASTHLGPGPGPHRGQGRPAQLPHLVQADLPPARTTGAGRDGAGAESAVHRVAAEALLGGAGRGAEGRRAAQRRAGLRPRGRDSRRAAERRRPTRPVAPTCVAGCDEPADDAVPTVTRRPASTPATPSTRSSSDPRISLRMRRAARSPKRRRAPTTRCSSTAASVSARRT